MEDSLLSRLYRAAASGDASSLLRPFVSTAFADLLGTCPGLAARLFGDIVPMPEGSPQVLTDVPATNDLSLDLVVEGREGFHLLIENQLAPALEWFEERTEVRPTSHLDSYIAAARHRFEGRAQVLVLSRSESDVRREHAASPVFAGSRSWSDVYQRIEEFASESAGTPVSLMRQFLHLLEEHDMDPSHPLAPNDADTIFAFDQLARNNLKLLDESVGRIRQEFDLKATPNNRRLTGWYACSDRFQSGDLHIFFYLMFPPVPDLVARAAVQVTKESSPRGLTAAAENGFRRGRWGSLWVERDFRKRHPFLGLTSPRQVEELVRFFQTPLARLAKAGLLKVAPAHQETLTKKTGPLPGRSKRERSVAPPAPPDQMAARSTDVEVAGGDRVPGSQPHSDGEPPARTTGTTAGITKLVPDGPTHDAPYTAGAPATDPVAEKDPSLGEGPSAD